MRARRGGYAAAPLSSRFLGAITRVENESLSKWLNVVALWFSSPAKKRWLSYHTVAKEVTRELFDSTLLDLERVCLAGPEFVDIASFVLSHLVIFHFDHFTNNVLKRMIESMNETSVRLAVSLTRTIIDPCSGFLYWAPRVLPEFTGREKFDFFASNSTDSQTAFGKALTELRLIIQAKMFSLLQARPQTDIQSHTIRVSSFLSNVIEVITPVDFRNHAIGCGFPLRTEVLIAISNYQKPQIFALDEVAASTGISSSLRSWGDLYTNLTSATPNTGEKMVFMQPEEAKDSVMIIFMKLICFTNPGVIYRFDDAIGRMIMDCVLSNDAALSSFAIVWTQSLIMVDPNVTFPIFDEIFRLIPIIANMPIEVLNTFVNALRRFVDVLCCLPSRYLTKKQCLNLNAFTLVTLCAPDTRLRCAGYKLAVALDRFECDMGGQPTIVRFIEEEQLKIERHTFALFEAFPAVHLWKDPLQNVSVLSFFEAMSSRVEILWQLMLSSVFTLAAEKFTQKFMKLFREVALKFVSGQSDTDRVTTKRRLFTLNILTGLGAMGQNPMLSFGETKEEEVLEVRQQSAMIVQCVMEELYGYIDMCYANISIMLSTVNVALFPAILPKALTCPSLEFMAVAMRGLAWNVHFTAICQSDDFRISFECVYSAGVKRLLEKKLTPSKIVYKLDEIYLDRISMNSQLVRDFLVVTYRILCVMKRRFSVQPRAPFPMCDVTVVDDDDFMETMHSMFPFIFACCLYPVVDDASERLHFYSLHSLSLWFDCCSPKDLSLFNDQAFMDLMAVFAKDVNSILFSLLKNNMNSLLSIYTQRSVTKDGSFFFLAVCNFFRMTNPHTRATTETLLEHWKSSNLTNPDPAFVESANILYHEGGNIVAACLQYMVIADRMTRNSAFVLLGSICPLLIKFNWPHRSEELVSLFASFLQIASMTITPEVVHDVSRLLVTWLSFCLEQILDRLFDAFTDIPRRVTTSVLYVLIPLVESITLNLEDRVVSTQTEFTFMRFSCCSFIERLTKLLGPLEIGADDSRLMVIWPPLAVRSGFDFVMLALIGTAQSSVDMHRPVISVMSTLYLTDPRTVLDCLTKHLSFMYWVSNAIDNPFTPESVVTEMLSISDSEEQLQPPSCVFILKVLVSIAEDNIIELMSYLPVIFAACVLNYGILWPSLNQILKAIALHMGHNTPPMVHDLLRVGEYDDSCVLANGLYKVLFDIGSECAAAFGLEILRWAVCCGDCQMARNAVRAYSAFLYPANKIVVGLFSRVLWILSSALSELTAADSLYDGSHYIEYIADVLQALEGIATIEASKGTLSNSSTIFWMAIDCLRCCKSSQEPIFNEAASIIVMHMQFPKLFAMVQQHGIRTDRTAYTRSVFWKVHSPWRETFDGVLPFICNYEGRNVDLCIRLLNVIVRAECPVLLTQKDNWMFIVLILLMPWIWKVVMIEMTRYMFTAEDVQLVDGTAYALLKVITEPKIVACLGLIKDTRDCYCYDAIREAFKEAVKRVDIEDVEMIMKFYTAMLKFGDKHLKLPLYALTTVFIENVSESVNFAQEFASLAEMDKDQKQPFYVKFLVAVGSDAKEIPKIDVEHIQEKTDSFPFLPLMERLVVVDVPHLGGFEEMGESVAECADPNLFIPFCPVDPCFVGVNIMTKIRNVLDRLNLPPFNEWSQLIGKGMTFMYDEQFDKRLVDFTAIQDFSVPLSRATEALRSDTLDTILDDEEFEMVGADLDEPEIEEVESEYPMDIVVLGAGAFVPTMAHIDDMCQDWVDQM